MAQPNAYIEIKGDAWKDAIAGKYCFKKIGDNYVAVIPFDIPADAENGWRIDHLQAWGKIGVGDNDLVVAADRQFNYSSGELNFVDKDHKNIDIAEIVKNTKGIIKVTADADGCKLETILY